jgi:hypothetical protein
MTDKFGGFVSTSPLSSLSHDPPLTLASNCIRDFFGPIVQTIFDALQKVGGSATLPALMSAVRRECKRIWNEERERLVVRGKFKLQRSKGPALNGYVTEASSIRAALLVLLQHDVVTVDKQDNHRHVYTVQPHNARLFTRYPRIVEYVKKVMDETAAAIVETLLLEGKLTTVDAIMKTVNNLSEVPKSDRYTHRQAVVETLHRMVEGSFVIQVPPLNENANGDSKAAGASLDDPAIVAMLSKEPYKTTLPRQAAWKVNWQLITNSLRAFCLGRLVAERYGHRVVSAGSIVSAALKFQTYNPSEQQFSPQDIVSYLPKPVQQAFEKKPGGLNSNLSKSLVELSLLDYPCVIEEIEEARGHPEGGKFSVSTLKLVKHLRDRTIHQFLFDCHGDVAARIMSVLRVQGACEAEPLAEAAMVPAKDTREILHRLYRENLVQLLNLQQGKQHNPASMIFLWSVDHKQLLRSTRDKVCTAMTNMRLRRQHESEIGKAWIERATDQDVDENEHEDDKVRYNKFCQGLERLDHAMIQLDETLMVLFDF